MMWDEKMRWNEVRWVAQVCDIGLDYYWPYDNMSGGGSFALGDPGSSSHENVNDWMSWADHVNGWGSKAGQSRMAWDFITILETVHNLKLMMDLWWQVKIHLPMQGTRIRSLVQEDPTCRGATKPVYHNYWVCAVEPTSHNYWSPCT